MWGLDEFVAVANSLLPSYVRESSVDARVKVKLSSRLVRSYTSEGLLDDPIKKGRNAWYSYRHLLQILVIRRLVSEGHSGSVVTERIRSATDSELELLLEGGMQFELKVANPALAFLRQVQNRGVAELEDVDIEEFLPSKSAPGAVKNSHWTRIAVVKGLEININDEFPFPGSVQEIDNVVETIRVSMKEHWSLSQDKRRRKHGKM